MRISIRKYNWIAIGGQHRRALDVRFWFCSVLLQHFPSPCAGSSFRSWFLTLTPSTDGRGAFQDPTHVSFRNSNSFWYYTRPEQARFIDSPVLFEANRVKNFYPTNWHREHQIMYVNADLVKT